MFLNNLNAIEIGESKGRVVSQLVQPLLFEDDEFKIEVQAGFYTDYASVPRLPIIYWLYGNRAHRGAVVHDYGYRKDSKIWSKKKDDWIYNPSRSLVDYIFKKCNIASGYPYYVYQGMWLGVRLGGSSSYHRMGVNDCFPLEVIYIQKEEEVK